MVEEVEVEEVEMCVCVCVLLQRSYLRFTELVINDIDTHGGHKILRTKIQDISRLFRTFSLFFRTSDRKKIRTFQDNFQEMVNLSGHRR